MTSQSIAGGEPAGAWGDVRPWAALTLFAAAWVTGFLLVAKVSGVLALCCAYLTYRHTP